MLGEMYARSFLIFTERKVRVECNEKAEKFLTKEVFFFFVFRDERGEDKGKKVGKGSKKKSLFVPFGHPVLYIYRRDERRGIKDIWRGR